MDEFRIFGKYVCILFLAAWPTAAYADDWPRFRGVNGQGIAEAKTVSYPPNGLETTFAGRWYYPEQVIPHRWFGANEYLSPAPRKKPANVS